MQKLLKVIELQDSQSVQLPSDELTLKQKKIEDARIIRMEKARTSLLTKTDTNNVIYNQFPSYVTTTTMRNDIEMTVPASAEQHIFHDKITVDVDMNKDGDMMALQTTNAQDDAELKLLLNSFHEMQSKNCGLSNEVFGDDLEKKKQYLKMRIINTCMENEIMEKIKNDNGNILFHQNRLANIRLDNEDKTKLMQLNKERQKITKEINSLKGDSRYLENVANLKQQRKRIEKEIDEIKQKSGLLQKTNHKKSQSTKRKSDCIVSSTSTSNSKKIKYEKTDTIANGNQIITQTNSKSMTIYDNESFLLGPLHDPNKLECEFDTDALMESLSVLNSTDPNLTDPNCLTLFDTNLNEHPIVECKQSNTKQLTTFDPVYDKDNNLTGVLKTDKKQKVVETVSTSFISMHQSINNIKNINTKNIDFSHFFK